MYRRAKVVHTLVTALEKACSRVNIQNAFLQAHLAPLKEDPPYTREREEELMKQALKAGIMELPKETDRKKEHITGIITSDSAIERIKARPDLVQSGSHERGRPSKATPASVSVTAKNCLITKEDLMQSVAVLSYRAFVFHTGIIKGKKLISINNSREWTKIGLFFLHSQKRKGICDKEDKVVIIKQHRSKVVVLVQMTAEIFNILLELDILLRTVSFYSPESVTKSNTCDFLVFWKDLSSLVFPACPPLLSA